MMANIKDLLDSQPLPKSILQDIGKLAEKNNKQVYVVGGVVRDLFLGRKLKEIDLMVIGDSFAELNQLDDALDSYADAANSSSNKFSAPKFLLKAGNIATLLERKSLALKYYKKIKSDYPKSIEASSIDIKIGKNSL